MPRRQKMPNRISRSMTFPAYKLHNSFTAPARAHPQLWRLALGLMAAALVTLCLNFGFVAAIDFAFDAQQADALLVLPGDAATPTGTLIVLFRFIFISAGIVVAAHVFHKRGATTLFGPLGPLRADFRSVIKALAILYAVLWLLPPWSFDSDLVPNLGFTKWLALLPLSLIAVLVQSSAEEILFRGYIQQQLAARFSSPLVWIVLPSVLFGLAHYTPAEAGTNAPVIALWATMFGLLMADLTARAGNLGPAMAVHFATNVSALLVTSLPDSLSGLSLFTVPYGINDIEDVRVWIPVDFAVMLVSWLSARLALRR
jgi:membrane protease YdiL (CAAX protease family)